MKFSVCTASHHRGHLGSTGQHKFLCCSVDRAKVLSGTRVRDRGRREDGSSDHQEGGGRQEEVKGNEYLPGCGPNGPRVEGGAVEVAAVRLMNMGLVRTESQSPEPSARSNLGEIPPSLSLQRLFPISSSPSLQGPDVSTSVLNCQVTFCLPVTWEQSPETPMISCE